MARTRTVITPATTSDFAKTGKLVYRKQILPKKVVNYTGRDGKPAVVNFDDVYLSKVAQRFAGGAMDQVGFLLADTDNQHTMDPERFRATVKSVDVASDGLYATIEFPSKEAAKAVLDNPALGVSARIREDAEGPTLVHVLGTLDPQVQGMDAWQPATADLSRESTDEERVLDLSRATYTAPTTEYEGRDMANKAKASIESGELVDGITDAEIDELSGAELDAFLAKFAPDFNEPVDEPVVTEPAGELVGAGAGATDLSNAATSRDIELANAAANDARSRANEAMRRMAAAEWAETRAQYERDGVPPHLLDLAAPLLSRPDDVVIDLSHTDDDDVNASEIVRGVLDAARGIVDIDLSNGHGDGAGSNDALTDALLAEWDKQTPAKQR